MEHISACSGPRSTPHQSLTFTAGKQLLGHATLTHFIMQEWAVLGRVFFGETSQAAKHTEKYRAQRRLCRHPDTSGITQLPGFASAKGQIRENNEKAEQKRFCFNHWLVPRRATVPSNNNRLLLKQKGKKWYWIHQGKALWGRKKTHLQLHRLQDLSSTHLPETQHLGKQGANPNATTGSFYFLH